MKLYVAGKYEDTLLVRQVMRDLRDAGHEITFDWTRDDEGFTRGQAERDLRAVREAEALVFVAAQKLPYKGAFVEMGYALALGLPVYVIGTGIDECLFTMLPWVIRGTADLLPRQVG